MRGSGDGFVRCSDGHVRWGRFGAAGVLFVHREVDGAHVLLQKRSAMAHEGGTWSVPGGALDEGETPLDGGLREASEEIGDLPAEHDVVGEWTFAPAEDWTYTTYVVEVAERFRPGRNWESDGAAWFRVDEVDREPLHAGFAAAWPHLRALL